VVPKMDVVTSSRTCVKLAGCFLAAGDSAAPAAHEPRKKERKKERKEGRKEGSRPPTPQSKLRISSLHDAGKATQSLTLLSSRNQVFPQFSVSRSSTRRENSFS
jgi:hypothetical protein